MHDALISVIVPVYQAETTLARCVRSLLAQTHQRLEVILVDDGSTDGSGALCDALAAGDARVRVLHTGNRGASAARNTGIAAAAGDYLGFVDSDDWLAPDAYARLLRLLLREDADIAFGAIQREEGRSAGPVPVTAEEGASIAPDAFWRRFFRIGTQACVFYMGPRLYRRAICYGDIYPEGIVQGEDVLATFTLFQRAGRIAETPAVVYHYWDNPKSVMHQPFSAHDLNLLAVWDTVVQRCEREAPALLPWATLNRRRTDFTLLARLALSPDPEDQARFAPQIAAMRASLRAHWRDLLKGPIPAGRKALIVAFVVNYPLACRVMRRMKGGAAWQRF